MSKFNRTSTPVIAPKYEKPWHDPNYNALRKDKKKISELPLTAAEERRLSVSNAQAMFKTFGFKPWMQGIIDQEGNEI